MLPKNTEKKKAIELRKNGKSYNEILELVPVSKSTLSLWLRDVGLSQTQKQRLTAKKRAAQKRGAARVHQIRLEKTKHIQEQARSDIKKLTKKEFFIIGISLYWAEGAKDKNDHTGIGVDFANSDPEMIRLFITWLLNFCNVSKQNIRLRLHLHENHKHREKELISLWSSLAGLPTGHFIKTNFKKHSPKTKRKNIGSTYIGLVSVRVKKSTDLNRRIQGWIYGIIDAQ